MTHLPAGGGLPEAGAAARAADGLAAVGRALELVQRWLAEPQLTDTRLVVVTRGAVSTEAPEDGDTGTEELNVAAAGLWGLLRSAQAEHPDRFVLLDLHQATDPTAGDVADAVARAVRADEPQAALRAGRWMVPRLMRARHTEGAAESESGGLTPAGSTLTVRC
ncbi:putative protein OS=Streptomyces antimycoticus OX=68175 GN=SANT12839_087190 PE=4 SV=1 [Streptomyces antimycoticus]